MIEVNMTYDFAPGADMNAYGEWAKKTVATIMQTPGLVEFRAHRNILGTPYVRTTTVWQSATDWVKFFESEAWQTIEAGLRAFIVNLKVELWGPSPIVSEPLRP